MNKEYRFSGGHVVTFEGMNHDKITPSAYARSRMGQKPLYLGRYCANGVIAHDVYTNYNAPLPKLLELYRIEPNGDVRQSDLASYVPDSSKNGGWHCSVVARYFLEEHWWQLLTSMEA